MPLTLTSGQFFQLSDGKQTVLPAAEEIFAVIFEGVGQIQGIAVTQEEFESTGLEFSRYAADPLLVLEVGVNTGQGSPMISCRIAAAQGNHEMELAKAGENHILDYALGANQWIPLPPGAVGEAMQFLRTCGIESFGSINMLQYMQVLRRPAEGLTVIDRTARGLSASSVAAELTGDVPSGFVGNLYPYQLDGFRWLSFMAGSGIGSIIADEMGLGKTVQVICLLLNAAKENKGPNLVLSPATLLENWRREIERFAPGLQAHVHSGPRRTGLPDKLRQHDVVIVSFETAVSDISLLRNVNWNVLVVDEAQGIKNPEARRTVQLKTLTRRCAVAITGTPVENRLKDLWSIIDFVVPALLGPLTEFEQRHPDTVSGATLLEPVVTPLILRRMVSQVARDLPERINIPQPLVLDEASAEAYEVIRSSSLNQGNGAGLSALTSLRMFSTHPWLCEVFRHILDPAECSVKLQRLMEILEEMISTTGKALIFTSYQASVDVLVAKISHRFKIPTDFIDGRVPVQQRQPKVDRFAAIPSSAVLVLNPKAAGTGLNITAANHVIHFNLEWNPAVEDQASARAYRRGQQKSVTVHQLFYVNTVEEVIHDRMQRKRQLAAAAIIGTNGRDQDIDDLMRAFRISPIKAS